ncbi:ankyrin repeat-containing domain protein [Cordyceps fumosorosea ARSEF 2679]|uniref:Ankyrin repeat-containing domain protein n=1 Tax=Cordyceps fumosorosea (strain ARSEF 2679) TaxID=1081104 RepID=A0A167UB71_CORFA|nr:ankyrin repeat-containing domain protein [Cordyceps fumosorosea ARSEF 2679]OAA61406.1 ankyrin repeat-containing domain protein [Cordyceps fumosorosea ARSEF 2679]
MNFSVGGGDLIKGIDLCRKLRRRFATAPRQCQQIADQVRSLSIVLQDIEVSGSDCGLTEADLQDLRQIAGGCHDVLDELSELVEKNLALEEKPTGSKDIAKRAWARVNWSPELAHSMQGRIGASLALLNAFQARITRTATARLLRHVEDQECQKILDWLSPAQYSREQSDLIARRHPNTGRWLLESAEFQRWLETPGAAMFCPGIPGAGKTILAASVVDHLLSDVQAGDGIGAAYIYLNFRRHDDQKLAHLLASLVKQLAQQDALAIEALKSMHSTHEKNDTHPSVNELERLLGVIVYSPSFQRVFVVVDALDECQTVESCRAKFISMLSKLGQAGKVNVFATSRPSPEIQNAFPQSSTIVLDIRAADEDVHAYLDGNLEELPNCIKNNTSLQDQIKSTISKAADGMFLLARVYLSQLDDKLTVKAVRTALGYFEEQGKKSGVSEAAKLEILSQAYDQTMERIQLQRPGFRVLAEKALLWIVSARRPLKVMEFLHALGIEENEPDYDEDNIPQLEDVISVCAGLVIVDEKSNVVRLVHYTTQEYFERRQDKWLPEAEWRIARACIRYLFTWRSWKPPASRPYLFLSSDVPADRLHSWGGRHALHFAAHFGLAETAKALLNQEKRPDAANIGDRVDRTPIFYAVRSGKEDIVHELVRRGATVLRNASSGEYATPLAVAAYYGHHGLIEFLVSHGARVNEPYPAWLFQYRCQQTTALLAAAVKGHTATVKVLLTCGADVEFENKAGQSALFCAAESGHADVVQCLIDGGADIEARNRELTTPLITACEGGHVEVVRLLLAHGADVEAADMRGKTAMRVAAEVGVEAVVLALLEAGAAADAREMWFDTPLPTPLLLACQAGHAHLAGLLLSRGAHVEAHRKFIHRYARYRDSHHSDLTPLLTAATKGHVAVAAVLLQHGADREATDAEWHTPLMLAAAGGHLDVAKLLVEAGAELHGVDRHGENAATAIWNAYSVNKAGPGWGRRERDPAGRAEVLAKQRELLRVFMAAGATLVTYDWEDVGSEDWEEWEEWNEWGEPVDPTGDNIGRVKEILAEQGLPVDEFHVWESLLQCHKSANGTLRLEYVMTCKEWGACSRNKKMGAYCPLPLGVPIPTSRPRIPPK